MLMHIYSMFNVSTYVCASFNVVHKVKLIIVVHTYVCTPTYVCTYIIATYVGMYICNAEKSILYIHSFCY